MVHLHTAVGQHAFQIALADWKLQIPAYCPQNDLRCELPTLERVLVILLHRQPLSTPFVVAQAVQASKLQQNRQRWSKEKQVLLRHAVKPLS